MKTRINVKSFDFDGCIFNHEYLLHKTQNPLIDANKKLISLLANEIIQEQYNKVILMVGSSRQSAAVDDANRNSRKGSCYSALNQLCTEFSRLVLPIKCIVDRYLLADTYGKTSIGKNFDNAYVSNHDYAYPQWLFDDSKLTILYAQMHKIASENKNSEIDYDFYDDRSDILNGLADFFNTNKDLIPSNLHIRLHSYSGSDIKDIPVIHGVGDIDDNFQQNIQLMIHCAALSYHQDQIYMNNVRANLLLEDRLIKFKQQRQLQVNNSNETFYSYENNNLFYKKPHQSNNLIAQTSNFFNKSSDNQTYDLFDRIYNIGNQRTSADKQWLLDTHYNIDVKKDGITPIYKHAQEGHHKAVAFLMQGGCSAVESVKGYMAAGYFSTQEKENHVLNSFSDNEIRKNLLQAHKWIIENPNAKSWEYKY